MRNPIGNEASIADREELRAKVWPDIEEDVNRVAYDVRYLRMFGTDAGILLSQLVYWTCKGDDPDGWLYFTKDEIRERFGLDTRSAVDVARHRLESAGVLSTQKRPRKAWWEGEYRVTRPSPVVHYLVNLLELVRLLERFEDDPDETIQTLNRDFKQSKSAARSHTRSHNSGDIRASEQSKSAARTAENSRLNGRKQPFESVKPAAPYTESTSESTSGTSIKASALQAGKKLLSNDNSKAATASLVLAAKEEKEEPYNTLGSEPHPFGDDGAWDRETTEGDEEPADSRSNGRYEDEDQAAVKEHNTLGSTDNHLGDHRELDRETTENLTEEQRQEYWQRLSSLMENEAMTHNTPGQALIPVGAHSELDRGDAVIESEEEVFEMARSVFGHAHEGEA